MVNFFGKPLDQIDQDDILSLIDYPEGQLFEIKSELPAEKNSKDSWYSTPKRGKKRKPGEYAKQNIFKEVVAFANSEGGWLVLGLKETTDHPKRVKEVAPLPDCHDLADNLKRAAYEWIDPPLPSLQCRGIAIGTNPGEGVVVFRVPRSLAAPHRLYKKDRTQDAYKRVSDESKPMRMREIQDLTLNIARGQERIEREFNNSRERYFRFKPQRTPKHQLLGFNITLICLFGPLSLDRLYLQDALFERKYTIGGQFQILNGPPFSINTIDAHPNRFHDLVQPILRGGRKTWWATHPSYPLGQAPKDDESFITLDIFESGTVQLSVKTTYNNQPRICIRWILADLANSLRIAERVRTIGGMPDAEYAMEIELGYDAALGDKELKFSEQRYALTLLPYDVIPMSGDAGHILLPTYPVRGCDEFQRILKKVMDDLYNYVGTRHIDDFEFGSIC
jgi:hypothetical protein